MGLPYSKQINAAFEQVTPLVAAGYEVLQTTKNISLMLAVIQVLTVVILAFILAALFAVLICINPDLEREKDAIVTPAVRAAAHGVETLMGLGKGIMWSLAIVGFGVGLGVLWGIWYTARDPTLRIEGEDDEERDLDEAKTGSELKGEDIEAIKKGETNQ